MTSLLPLYNQILTYKQQRGLVDEDEVIDELQEAYGLQKHKYYKFVLFPEIFEPCRPPMMFPYATHMFRDVGSQTLTASGGALYLQWLPLYRSNGTLRNELITYNGSNANTLTGDVTSAVTGEVLTSFSPPIITGIDGDHIRGLAAYLTVTYIGRADELSGIIEIGISVDDMITSYTTGSRVISTSALKSCYQYKKMDVSEGVRAVWLPLQDDALEFSGMQATHNGVNAVYNIHITGAPTSAGVFRIDYGYYYDGLVDETGYNTLLPKKPAKNQYTGSQIVAQVRNNVEDFAVTKGIASEQGFASKLWNIAKSKIEGVAVNLANEVGFGDLVNNQSNGNMMQSIYGRQGFWK